MDLFFNIVNIIIGVMMTLIGFKIYNPIRKKMDQEKEAEWYSKFGTFFKIGGIFMILLGCIQTLNHL